MRVTALCLFLFVLLPATFGTAEYEPAAGPELIETGVASWYGPNFHGNPTASGEIYDMHQLTAAHRQLPFGSTLRVTDLSSGRTVIVRVNDRGPFVGERVLDLSYAAARKLGVLRAGLAQVRFEKLDGAALVLEEPVPVAKAQGREAAGPGQVL